MSKLETEKTLVFLFYSGVKCRENGASAASTASEAKKLLSFVQSCASLPRVFVLSVFDCCASEFAGLEDIAEKFDSQANAALIFREHGVCASLDEPNMVKRFFGHISDARSNR